MNPGSGRRAVRRLAADAAGCRNGARRSGSVSAFRGRSNGAAPAGDRRKRAAAALSMDASSSRPPLTQAQWMRCTQKSAWRAPELLCRTLSGRRAKVSSATGGSPRCGVAVAVLHRMPLGRSFWCRRVLTPIPPGRRRSRSPAAVQHGSGEQPMCQRPCRTARRTGIKKGAPRCGAPSKPRRSVRRLSRGRAPRATPARCRNPCRSRGRRRA